MNVCRILSDYHRREDYLLEKAYGDMQQVMEAYATLRVSEETKGMYPKEFVEWMSLNTEYYPYGNTYFRTDLNIHFVGLDLLFEYWKQNISK